MAVRKLNAAAQGPVACGPGLADANAWPCILEYLVTDKYPDGEKRETSALVIVADGSGWRGCVSDKDNNRTLWRTAATVEGLLLELETALAADDPAAWRQAGGFKGRKRK